MGRYKVRYKVTEVHEQFVEAGNPYEAFLAVSEGLKSIKSDALESKEAWLDFELVAGKPFQTFKCWGHWASEFPPVHNPIRYGFLNELTGEPLEPIASLTAGNSDTVFSDSDEEVEFLDKLIHTQIWTVYEHAGLFRMTSGYLRELSFVLGYVVTEREWSLGKDYLVHLGHEEECWNCDDGFQGQDRCEFCKGTGHEIIVSY